MLAGCVTQAACYETKAKMLAWALLVLGWVRHGIACLASSSTPAQLQSPLMLRPGGLLPLVQVACIAVGAQSDA
jgi:hypothetical protein